MVVLPAGHFTMGSLVGEEGRENHEGPQRTVTIGKPFAVGKFEVTFAEWDECVAAGGCKYRPADKGWGRGRRPVINVSWDDITREYLPWLSHKTGKPYALLTEAEWEYAARAGTTTPFSTGHTIANHEANFNGGFTSDGRAKGVYRDKTTEVGSFNANTFGLHDMHGNLWEWVQDCWKDNYVDSPIDGSVWTTQECRLRVLRGGSWNFYPEHLRSAARLKARQDIRFNFFGFRVARKLD
jgi:formylglycine-generating enzyme required for sulfatase activity